MTESDYLYQINGKEFIFSINLTNTNLSIVLETPNETNYWYGNFEATMLEEMTRKAKSHKTFEVFSKMLISGLTKESEIVKLELLNYSDLEKMKQSKTNLNSSSNTNTNTSTTTLTDNNKINDKFLVVKYFTDFEHSQYPLRLVFVKEPDYNLLSKTIKRLRKNKRLGQSIELDSNFTKEIDDIKSENISLKGKLKLIESHRQSGAVENDEYIRSVSTIKEEFENYKGHAENKMKILVKTIEELKNKVNSQSDNINSSHQKVEESLRKKINDLEIKNEKLGELLITERGKGKEYIDNQNAEFINTVKELQFMKENEKKLKVKINQLEKELEQANKQMKYATYGTLKSDKNKVTGTPKSTYSYNKYSVKSNNNSNKGSVYSGKISNYSGKVSNYSGRVSNYTGKSSNYSGSAGSKNSFNYNIKKNPFDKKVDLKGLNSKKYSEYKVKASPTYSKKSSDSRSYSNSKNPTYNNYNSKTNAIKSTYTNNKYSSGVYNNNNVKSNTINNNYKKTGSVTSEKKLSQYTSSTTNRTNTNNISTIPKKEPPKSNNYLSNDNKGTDVTSRLEKLEQLINKTKKWLL